MVHCGHERAEGFERSRVQEKGTPHFSLQRAQDLIRDHKFYVTDVAFTMATTTFVGLVTEWDIAECILLLTRKDFFKSMTSLYDHKTWQDVYHKSISGKGAYIKIQIREDPKEQTVIISFKAKEGS